MSYRPTRDDPDGYIYVVFGKNFKEDRGLRPDGRFYTKIGISKLRLEKGVGRYETAEFWLKTFGLGTLEVEWQDYHARAFYVEQEIHKVLRLEGLRNEVGRSRESFNIAPELAAARVKDFTERL